MYKVLIVYEQIHNCWSPREVQPQERECQEQQQQQQTLTTMSAVGAHCIIFSLFLLLLEQQQQQQPTLTTMFAHSVISAFACSYFHLILYLSWTSAIHNNNNNKL